MKENRTVNKEFYIKQKYPSKWRWNKHSLRKTKAKTFVFKYTFTMGNAISQMEADKSKKE